MKKEEIIGWILKASQEQLDRITAIFNPKAIPVVEDRRTYNAQQAANVIGVSRSSIVRYVKEGRLQTIETRNGRRRITSTSLTAFSLGGAQ